MRYIGRIISKTKIEGVSEFIEVTQDTSFVVEKKCKIPTLVIGYSFVKELFGKDIMVTKKKISDNLFWTFSKRERRTEFDVDIQQFLKEVVLFTDKFNKYEFVDLITSSKSDIGDFFLTICESCKKILYKTDSMLYVYIPLKRKTIGVSLMAAEYMDINKDSLLSHFNNEAYFVPDDFSIHNLQFNNEARKIPFLWYLKSF